MIVKPMSTEKAVKLMEIDNTLIFEVDRRANKPELRKEFERIFKIKVDSIKTLIRSNKKIAYVKLNKSNLAVDLATKLGMM